jgi:hypothetical protein
VLRSATREADFHDSGARDSRRFGPVAALRLVSVSSVWRRSCSRSFVFELLVRFVVGGCLVSLFALGGDLVKPKTFAGLFGAAPSVAIGGLAIAMVSHGGAYVATEGRSMVIGAVAMGAYSLGCAWVVRLEKLPSWAGVALLWTAWLAAAFGLKAAILPSS